MTSAPRLPRAICIVCAIAVLGMRQATAADHRLAAVDASAIAAAQNLPLPSLPAGGAAWATSADDEQVIDDFESPSWPDRRYWALVTDLNGADGGDYYWAPRDCHV